MTTLMYGGPYICREIIAISLQNFAFSYNLHLKVFKLFHSVLGIAKANLFEGLVLVTSLLYILSMQQIHSTLLAFIATSGQLNSQRLIQRGGSYFSKPTNHNTLKITASLAAIALFLSAMCTLSISEPTPDSPSMVNSEVAVVCPSS